MTARTAQSREGDVPFPQPSVSSGSSRKTLKIITSHQNWASAVAEAGKGQDHEARSSLRDRRSGEVCLGGGDQGGNSLQMGGITQQRPTAVNMPRQRLRGLKGEGPLLAHFAAPRGRTVWKGCPVGAPAFIIWGLRSVPGSSSDSRVSEFSTRSIPTSRLKSGERSYRPM